MVIDHSSLGQQIKRIFWVRQVYFTKSCQQQGWVNQPFILFIHHIWGETVLRRCIYRTDLGQNAVFLFTVFQDKLHPANIQDDKSWAFTETVQNISKLTYTASRFSVLTSAKFAVRAVSSIWVNINRVRLQHYKEFIMFFLFNSFIAELWRAKLACGAPWVSKSTHPRNFGNHVTVHRPPVRPHHRETNVKSHIWCIWCFVCAAQLKFWFQTDLGR